MTYAGVTTEDLVLLREYRSRRRASSGAGQGVDSLLAFTLHTKPDYHVGWHHRVLCEYLDRFVAGDVRRLMVFMPPRHGKSELVSRRLPAYILGKNPNATIIASSYSADLASRMNRDVQRIIDTPEYAELYPDTQLYGKNIRTTARGAYLRNSDIFEVVGHMGVYRSAGVGGGITGMGGQYLIIDDPIKNREEADSQTYREALWEWYTSTFYTRLEKDGAILITLTRWHEDDLAARLLSMNAEPWTVLRFPAVADARDQSDADPREDGAPLWPEKYNAEQLDTIRATIGTRQWEALYQQRPRAPEGDYFKRGWFEIVKATPAQCTYVRYWDLAGGVSTAADQTAGVLMARDRRGYFYVVDVLTGRWAAAERNSTIKQTAALDAQKYGDVRIVIEQAPGLSKEPTEDIVRQLAGYPVYADRVTRDKVSRAEPFQAQAQAGNVRVLDAPWAAPYLDELCSFPTGTHDDQVDATSGAFNQLADVADITLYTPTPGRNRWKDI